MQIIKYISINNQKKSIHQDKIAIQHQGLNVLQINKQARKVDISSNSKFFSHSVPAYFNTPDRDIHQWRNLFGRDIHFKKST